VKEQSKNFNIRLWQRIAVVAGIFSFIICILIIANFIQINKADPINTETINTMVQRLNEDPSNDQLREDIRVLDLLARKAYFTTQWQIRTGGYMLLFGVALIIISMQLILANRKLDPKIEEQKGFDLLLNQKITRRWVSFGGGAVVIIALIFAFITHQNLNVKFNNELITQVVLDEPVVMEDTLKVINKENVDEVLVEEDELKTADSDIKTEIDEVEETIVIESNVSTDQFMNFRGPGGLGLTNQKNVPISWDGTTGENILWKTEIPMRGFNSPIIWGNKLFMSGGDKSKQEVYCIDKNTGEFLWTYNVENVPGSPEQPPEVANYTGFTAPTTATDGKKVFGIFANGDMVSLDMNGNLVWAKNLGVPENHYGYSSSLICYNNMVIVQYDQSNKAHVMALSVNNGDILWDIKREVKISWSSPVIVSFNGHDELILLAEPFVISYNPDDGNELWRMECILGEVGPSPAYADGILYTTNEYSILSAIKMGSTPEILWESEDFLSDVPSPVATSQYLIVPTSYGMVACYDSKTGEIYWEEDFDNTIYSSPLISENKVYLIDKSGITHIFEMDKEFKLISRPNLGERIVCTPAFGDGRIYLRGYDHLFCIGNK